MLRRQLLASPLALAAALPLLALADDDKKNPDETLTTAQIDAWVAQITSTINAPANQAVASTIALGQLASNLKARLGGVGK